MLCNLFDEENNQDNSIKIYVKNSKGLLKPEEPRNQNDFCGIINQGATCYLNTLIQTLFLTPEFRNGLFSLQPDELGLVPTTGGNIKVRVIPLELQRLFAELLLLDQDSCSTKLLTDSFGWSNQEGTEQHDVQELNRILFSAIETSLVNTKQSQLIQKLYKGTIINKIHCLSCLTTKSREEEFLDLQVTVQGSNNLSNSLINSFIIREQLNGNNQYKCETCNKYVDAEKYCQLKTLPPILTLSLLRFTYDMKTWQRIKISDKFEFPFELDLKDYLEDNFKLTVPDNYSKYELFSVIIHSGSAYGGHYHTYIKDIDNLGNWSIEETKNEDKKRKKTNQELLNDLNLKEITLIRENYDDKDLDMLKYDSPLELLKAFIYNNYEYKQIKVESICGELNKTSGMSWNKNFKSKYGTINKFLKKNDHVFELTPDEKIVNLKLHDAINEVLSINYEAFIEEKLIKKQKLEEELEQQLKQEEEDDEKEKQEQQIKIENKFENLNLDCWFDFNDSRVSSIKSSLIQKQFEGKESAYMLFYRRKRTINFDKENVKIQDKTKQVPNWLLNEINAKNETLKNDRKLYDRNVNEITLKFYLDLNFIVSGVNKILNLQNEASFISLTIDKRDKVNSLKEKLINYCTTIGVDGNNDELNETFLNYILCSTNSKYLVCKQNQFGFNYISKILNDDDNFVNFPQHFAIILSNSLDLFQVGDQYEPIQLIVKYYYDEDNTNDNFKRFNEFSEIFTKQTTIKEIKDQLSDITCNNKKRLTLTLLNNNKKHVLNRENGLTLKNLSEYQVKNGDYLIIENDFDVNGINVNINDAIVTNGSKKVTKPTGSTSANDSITIEIVNFIKQNDEITNNDDGTKFTQIELAVNNQDHASDIKILAISAFSLDNINYDMCHLRYINTANINRTDLINEYKLKKTLCNGQRLFDNDKIENFIDLTSSNLFALCDGRPPLDNEITIKCCCMLDNFNDNAGQCLIDDVKYEIILNKLLTVNDLIKRLTEDLDLSLNETDIKNNQTFYIKTINWMGDPDLILNNLTKTLNDVNLVNNSYICLTKGFLVPQNHVKINIWLHDTSNSNLNERIKTKLLNCDVNQINNEFKYINCMICKFDLKLGELKLKIIECLNKNLNLGLEISEENDDIIRLRIMKKLIIKNSANKKIYFEKYQIKKALVDWHKTLKQLNLSNEIDFCVQLLETGNLNQGIMLLDCLNLNLKSNDYVNHKEISWNINNGATLLSLKQAIIKEYNLEQSDLYHVFIAKRLIDKYDWLLIKDGENSTNNEQLPVQQASKRGRKPKQPQQQQQLKSNLKTAPYYLDDGDLIAFVVLNDAESLAITTPQTISNKEFLTKYDKDYKANIIDLTKLRKTNKGKDVFDQQSNKGKRSNRRPEVGISIKTEDYTN